MIVIKDFSKEYKNKKILDDINLTIEENKISFLMGKNGAGKTTLLKCIASLENYNGQILIDEKENINSKKTYFIIWDDCPYYVDSNGIDNLFLLSEGKYSKKEICDIVKDVMNESLLKKKVKRYSYGEKKKLSFALVMLLNPSVIIMDEITNGLDFDTLVYLKERLLEWSKDKTIFLTGHQFSFYDGMVDDVY
uniref:ATP-binding cassette domain-containing protein n=1 Tax=Eubacterium sp. TaxID=142586 RepID=UPI0025DE1F3F